MCFGGSSDSDKVIIRRKVQPSHSRSYSNSYSTSHRHRDHDYDRRYSSEPKVATYRKESVTKRTSINRQDNDYDDSRSRQDYDNDGYRSRQDYTRSRQEYDYDNRRSSHHDGSNYGGSSHGGYGEPRRSTSKVRIAEERRSRQSYH